MDSKDLKDQLIADVKARAAYSAERWATTYEHHGKIQLAPSAWVLSALTASRQRFQLTALDEDTRRILVDTYNDEWNRVVRFWAQQQDLPL